MPAAFENVDEARQVAVDIGVRVRERIPDARLRGEVHDARRPVLAKHGGHRRVVGEIELEELETRHSDQLLESRLLEADVVVVVDDVETDHLVAAVQQATRDVEPDESGGAGDKNFHRHGALLTLLLFVPRAARRCCPTCGIPAGAEQSRRQSC